MVIGCGDGGSSDDNDDDCGDGDVADVHNTPRSDDCCRIYGESPGIWLVVLNGTPKPQSMAASLINYS